MNETKCQDSQNFSKGNGNDLSKFLIKVKVENDNNFEFEFGRNLNN